MATDNATAFDPATCDLPIYATQGGGYATFVNGQPVWHADIPDFLGNVAVGDPIPEEWGLTAVNAAAHRQMDEDSEFGSDDYLQ